MKDVGPESKRARELAFPAVDEAIANWMGHFQDKRAMLGCDLIKARAIWFAVLSGTPDEQLSSFPNVWLQALPGTRDIMAPSNYFPR